MITLLTITVLLVTLYGLAWHDEPAKKPERVRDPKKK